ncbi:MAG: HDOD domain-containing protein [Bryobacteraceae bacterium]
MKIYLGRQPILDRKLNVAGYELLFRSSRANFCDLSDDVLATSQVIVNAVLGVGLERLLGGKRAFIKFDRTLLLGDWTTLLPPEKSVIEILETVTPDQEVLAACHRLRRQGYALALDECLDDERTTAFAPCVDILKVDFLQTSSADQEKLARRYQKLKIGMVAGKIETEPEFQRALQLGYDYFQGYFLAHPTILQLARIPVSQMRALRLMKLIQREELDYPALEELIRQDVSLTHSLLTYVNSGAFQWADRVRSIRRGLVLLGAGEIRKWGWMASLSSLGGRRPAVLIAQVLMRGRFCEAIACSAKLPLGESDPFLLGMLSLLDALLERPLQGIHDDLNIGRNIQSALLETAGEVDPLSLILRIVKSYEVGDWDDVEAAARVIGLSAGDLTACYLESLTWVDAVSSSADQKRRSIRLPVPIDFPRQPEIRYVTQH